MFLVVFDELLNRQNLNKHKFAKLSGIPYTTIDGFYKKGYENIRLTTLRKIADFFDVSLDYLVFGKESNNKGIILNQYEEKLIKDFRNMSEQGQEYILQTSDMAKDRYKKDILPANEENKNIC